MLERSPGELDWLCAPAVQPPSVLAHWDGETVVTLAKLPDASARLRWVFDVDHPGRLGLFVHLTDAEAQAVYDTPPETGLLERVRPSLADADALLWASDGEFTRARIIEIPRSGSEEALWDSVWRLAELPYPWIADVVELSEADPDVRLEPAPGWNAAHPR